MQRIAISTPVALFVFNRPDTTRRVFEAIAKVRPAKLLLVADGPRPDKLGEVEACQQVRNIVALVDWPCQVDRNFSETNLGCQERMISGLNWVFSLVEEAIILEDDCLPDQSFFPFCGELLERYRGDTRVAAISGANLVAKHSDVATSYFFSHLGGIWGWATWQSEWQKYDRYLSNWPQLKREQILSELFADRKTVDYWTAVFDDLHDHNGRGTWDYQWLYTRIKNNALTIIPRVNLVANIGFGPDATHTIKADPRFTPAATAIEFPLRHPSSFIPLRRMDRQIQALNSRSTFQRIASTIRRIAKRLSLVGI